MNDKIRPEHLQRTAFVYVRQSSGHQVRHHRESRQRQYALADRARELGFAKTVVVDEDQGRSGSGAHERPGFGRLLTAVCEGEAGAVLALEASRLARNNRDWHHLIDLCALTGALILDADGAYDPQQLNDRLLLGLKGSMAEFELGLFRQRARVAFEQKIKRGHALWEMPVGFVRTEESRIEKIPDRQVQAAVEGVFEKFRELGSARQTMIWYRDEHIPLPQVLPGAGGYKVVWRLPTGNRVRQMLKNPTYAGVLAYGKTSAKTMVDGGRIRRATSRRRKEQEEWSVFIPDNHPGYISWDEYLRNQRTLESNLAKRGASTPGAPKRGPALLAGLLRCGRCGRRLFVAYGGRGGCVPRYACCGGRTGRGSAHCQSVGGLSIEEAVAEQVLEAIRPAGVEAAVAAVERLSEAHAEKQRSVELTLEKARYEARRAERQYDAADPENRLVAGELEARWNEALSRVSELEQERAGLKASHRDLSVEERDSLHRLGRDLPSLWHHPDASHELKKRILRTVLHEIVVDTDEEQHEHRLHLHWQGGVHTTVRAPRNRPGIRRVRTEKTAIELIQELSKVCSDQAIAAILNRLGYRTGGGKTWRVHSVHQVRYYYQLANHRNGDSWLTVSQAAEAVGVSHTVIRRLIRDEVLPAKQVVESTPWIVKREDLALPEVRQDVEAVRRGRQLRRRNPNQGEIPLK